MSKLGKSYYTTVGGQCESVTALICNPPLARPVTNIRPLSIGAAYQESFEFLCPTDWNTTTVRAKLFETLPMREAGWEGCALVKLTEGGLWRVHRT